MRRRGEPVRALPQENLVDIQFEYFVFGKAGLDLIGKQNLAKLASKRSLSGEEEVAWRCQNVAGCPAQKTRRLEYFAQRKALDIESLGGTVAEKLVESGLAHEPLDLFEGRKKKRSRKTKKNA